MAIPCSKRCLRNIFFLNSKLMIPGPQIDLQKGLLGIKLISNSTRRVGGIPGRSSGNTTGKSQSSDMSAISSFPSSIHDVGYEKHRNPTLLLYYDGISSGADELLRNCKAIYSVEFK
ncbi:hypothetical protein L1887_06538 [Cichorium endivia]|nr:hypothetical protein L1887_06538 [Cichorium endivia]